MWMSGCRASLGLLPLTSRRCTSIRATPSSFPPNDMTSELDGEAGRGDGWGMASHLVRCGGSRLGEGDDGGVGLDLDDDGAGRRARVRVWRERERRCGRKRREGGIDRKSVV